MCKLWAVVSAMVLAAPLSAVAATATDYTATVVKLDTTGFTGVLVYSASSGQLAGQGFPGTHSGYDALVWSATNGSVADLNPTWSGQSGAKCCTGSQQVGFAEMPWGYFHAVLWNGTSSSAVDLNPVGVETSVALGACSGQQVGSGHVGTVDHAFLWRGSAASAVDLHPAGYFYSHAYAVGDGQQVGFGNKMPDYGGHLLLWSGTADSVVDLSPAGYSGGAWINAVGGGQQVGYGYGYATGQFHHALLWRSTAESVIDLQPPGFDSTEAYGLANGWQVGYGNRSSVYHYTALLWNGTANSAVDLGALLNPTLTDSYALGIDGQRNVFGYAQDADGNLYAVTWTPIPEPTTAAMTLAIALVLVRRRSPEQH